MRTNQNQMEVDLVHTPDLVFTVNIYIYIMRSLHTKEYCLEFFILVTCLMSL